MNTTNTQDPIKLARHALVRIESAVDWHLGRSSFTQTKQLKGLEHSNAVRKELFAAHDEVRNTIAALQPAAAQPQGDAREALSGFLHVGGAKVYCCYGMYADVGHSPDCKHASTQASEPSSDEALQRLAKAEAVAVFLNTRGDDSRAAIHAAVNKLWPAAFAHGFQCGKRDAPAPPEGWRMVPLEPTPEMLAAIWAYKSDSLEDCYRAMLAAAPQPGGKA